MIKIIKEGTRKIAKCPNCGCELSYEEEDVLRDPIRIENHANCPQCDKTVIIMVERR